MGMASAFRNLKLENRTRINRLVVWLRIRNSLGVLLQGMANFGSATLLSLRMVRKPPASSPQPCTCRPSWLSLGGIRRKDHDRSHQDRRGRLEFRAMARCFLSRWPAPEARAGIRLPRFDLHR